MEINPKYVINSLVSQIAQSAKAIAERDAAIAQLNEEVEVLREQVIGKMDEDAE